jgi:hypothetical protein
VKNLRARLIIFSVTLAAFAAAVAPYLQTLHRGRGFYEGSG